MRTALIVLPLALLASSAFAQPAPSSAPQIQRVLNDPAMADRMANVMQAMSHAFLDLPVGEVEAALQGRAPTPADRARTLRTEDPNLDREVQDQVAQARPVIRQSMRAMADALPGMMQGLHQAQKSLERAVANMPDPNYPKR
jgi:hypothetical protein